MSKRSTRKLSPTTGKYDVKKQGTKTNHVAKRNYKDTVFRTLFLNKENLLSLYNAVNDTNYDNPDDLMVTTLDNAIYMSMKNDVSCVVDMRLNLYEHQSTINPNIPLRDLHYVSDTFLKFHTDRDIYSPKLIPLPNPKFIIFYNGEEEQPAVKKLRLSEAYVDKVRTYQKQMSLTDAVDIAVDECIEEGILCEFLKNNKAVVKNMSIYEYDEELHIKTMMEIGREEGIQQGIQGTVTVLKDMCWTDDAIIEKLIEVYSLDIEEARKFL